LPAIALHLGFDAEFGDHELIDMDEPLIVVKRP
jgi:hypothetical protein